MTANVTDIRTGALLTAALEYVSRGWHVFPIFEVGDDGNCTCTDGPDCGNPGKHPRTPRGLLNATDDPKQVKKWWKRWPKANVAIACGLSGLVVVDVDPRNGGDATAGELEAKHGRLPETPRAVTGGGGSHELFSMPDGVPSVRSGKLGLGVDIKAEGGYIIAAPSNHYSGSLYTWDSGAHPSDTKLAPCPKWVLDRLARKDLEQYETAGVVTDSFLGAAFDALGMLGRSLGPDKAAVECPWEQDHTGGKRYDGSTVLFAPRKGKNTGWWYCSHSHCSGRVLADVLNFLSPEAKSAARDKLGLDAQYDPPTVDEPQEIDTTEAWTKVLRFTLEGQLTRDAGNAALLLANVPEWKGALQYDEFADRIRWVRPVPEMPGFPPPQPGDDLADHHATYVAHWFAKFRNVAFPKIMIQDALDTAARVNRVHPVREYLDALEWDRKPRAATFLHTYIGATDEPYSHMVGRFWLISAVARIYRPGAQVDHILVLEGGQGTGKSTAVRILAGDWYLPNLPDIQSKDASQMLQGHWIAEIGELDALKGAAGTRIKDFISRTVDTFRPAYARFAVRRPRSCVFIGTTNETQYLTDSTGARRFWPVACGELQRNELIRDRDQIWAEAKHWFDTGEQWWPHEENVSQFTEKQDERLAEDEWTGPISEWAATQVEFTIGDVLGRALMIEPGKWSKSDQTRAGFVLRKLGFRAKQQRKNGVRVRLYSKQSQPVTTVTTID